jgi:hypothetical protein
MNLKVNKGLPGLCLLIAISSLTLTACGSTPPLSEGEVDAQLSRACSEISAAEEFIDQGYSKDSEFVQNHYDTAFRIGRYLAIQMSEYEGFEYLSDLADGFDSNWSWCGLQIDPSYE